MSSAAARLGDALRKVGERRALRAMLEGAALGLAVAGGILVVLSAYDTALGALLALSALCAALGVALRSRRLERGDVANAMVVESGNPRAQNVVRTAAELLASPARATPHVTERVLTAAAACVEDLDVAALVPLHRSGMQLTAVIALWGIALSISPTVAPTLGVARGGMGAAFGAIEVVVDPPAYTRESSRTERAPERLVVRAGSRLTLRVRTRNALLLEHLAGRDTLRPDSAGLITTSLRADADDALILSALAADGSRLERRLIGLSVTPDLAPRVRVTAPGRDLLYPDGRRTLAVAVHAEDDLALAWLRLRFTKVSGSGEVFAFAEGEVPLSITQHAPGTWEARGTLRLDTLGLEPGDLVVYRGVAADRRPDATPSESDTWIVEITAPGAVAAEGFAADDDQDRYALSQQMVIIKTERLIAQRESLSADDFSRATLTLAAEQRSVRAEFVFMMGGELADDDNDAAGHLHVDEAAEAEAEDDILAGRLANQGRLELTRAIRAMSGAITQLNGRDLTAALVEERRALVYIERALARSRFILRALTERERLDLSRRLTGTLSVVRADLRTVPEPRVTPRTATLRAALAALTPLAGDGNVSPEMQRNAADIATRVVQLAPGDSALQGIAGDVLRAVRPRTTAAERRRLVEDAIVRLLVLARAGLPAETGATEPAEWHVLRGMVRDAERR